MRVVSLVALTWTMAACMVRVHPPAPAEERLPQGVALASFDTLWHAVNSTYVDTAFVASRWVAVRDSLRPLAEQATTRRELDRLLARAVSTIPDSHFYIIPEHVARGDAQLAAADGRGSTGLSVRVAGDAIVAWQVDVDGPAARAGITPGQTIETIGTSDTKAMLARALAVPLQGRTRARSEMLQRLNGALRPKVGDTVSLRVRGKRGVLSLAAVPAVGRVSKFGNLPPIASVATWERVPLPGGGCAGVVAFNIWLPELAPELEQAVDSVASCRGVVVDLRGNGGGVAAMVMGFGGFFVDSAKSLGRMQMRSMSLTYVINPQKSRVSGAQVAPYAGPLAILVDPMTGSTSEIFAGGMQSIGRARVFGERSAGAALPALTRPLPSGDIFVHAVADFTDPAGVRIEGEGVVPDVEVPLSVRALEEGRDEALEAALRWIGGSAESGDTGTPSQASVTHNP